MKKILLVLVVAIFISSLCFAAQRPAAPISQTSVKSIATKTFTGKVASVSVGNEAKGITSDILVADEGGRLQVFGIKPSTLIAAKDGKVITLSEIKKDSKVDIEYKSAGKEINTVNIVHEAQSIKLVE